LTFFVKQASLPSSLLVSPSVIWANSFANILDVFLDLINFRMHLFD
jgi:hypothetical protein